MLFKLQTAAGKRKTPWLVFTDNTSGLPHVTSLQPVGDAELIPFCAESKDNYISIFTLSFRQLQSLSGPTLRFICPEAKKPSKGKQIVF